DFTGIDVGGNYAIASHRHPVPGKIDGALDPAVNVKRFRTGDLAFDYQRLAYCGLIRSGGRYRARGSGFAHRGRSRRGHRGTLRLSRTARRSRLVCGLPHDAQSPFLVRNIRIDAAFQSPNRIVLPPAAWRLWKSSIFLGIFVVPPHALSVSP